MILTRFCGELPAAILLGPVKSGLITHVILHVYELIYLVSSYRNLAVFQILEMSGGFRQTFPFQEVVYFNLPGHQLNEILDVRQPTQPIATYRYGYDFSINLKFRAVKSSSCVRKEQVNTFAKSCMRNPPPRVSSRSLNEMTVSDSEFAMYCCRWRKQSLRGR